VKLFSSAITDSTLYKSNETWFKVPHGLTLGPKQNHITFEFGSIYFKNPEDVLYKYKLLGIDKVYTTSNNPVIIYPALPPGKYTLMVTGITKSGGISSAPVEYSFEIEKAFYQTRFFQVVVVLLLLATGGLIAYVLTRGRQKRKQKAKELLEKIREEEFMKLRQRTAEDFHDEMGNSLTRISVLTDILKSKLNGHEGEMANLVKQIKENTTSLYNGSKDIIWSLNSQNDGLYEITEHIKDIGVELFNETPIDFNYHHNIRQGNSLKLKLDYSRNLTMIFKEAYSNILKYSKAGKVDVSIDLEEPEGLTIKLEDDGIGFERNSVQNGNGLRNMENRVKRMNGEISIDSSKGHGTHISIKLKTIFA
jgi:signal transduction histidine kinase